MTNFHEEDKVFTGTQVGAVLESLRHEISLIAEGQSAFREDVNTLKEDVRELKMDMRTVKDVLRINIPRLDRLETKIGL